MQYGACVIHRAVQDALDCPDALRVQALLRLNRTQVHERVTDFLLLLGRHAATSITAVSSNRIPLPPRSNARSLLLKAHALTLDGKGPNASNRTNAACTSGWLAEKAAAQDVCHLSATKKAL